MTSKPIDPRPASVREPESLRPKDAIGTGFFDWAVDPPTLKALKTSVDDVKSEAIDVPAQVFYANIEKLTYIATLPVHISADGIRTWLMALARAGIPDESGRDDAANAEIEKRVRERYLDIVNKQGVDTISGLIRNAVSSLRGWPEIVRAESSLRYACVILLWTALENLARDLWISAVNVSETAIAHRVIKSLPSEPTATGITRRSIDVSVLARHHFDLRGRLGWLLESKFKSSMLEGIREAYEAAFDHPASFVALFDNKELTKLEKTRHLLVHRAGIVDERFKKLTDCSNEVGEALELPAGALGTSA